MRKHVFGRQLSRDTNERKALFRNLMSELVLHERIQTTEQKAKAIKGNVEKLVTKAKKNGPTARVLISPYLTADATEKMLAQIAPRFADRPGGYTRIMRLDRRLQDNATMVIMEWVERSQQVISKKKQEKSAKNIDEVMADVAYGKEKETKAKSEKKVVKESGKETRTKRTAKARETVKK